MKCIESADKKFAKDLIAGATNQAKTWFKFDYEVGEVETKIPLKYKELISIGIALTTQCPYCLEKQAKERGATQEEISETILITAALRSGAAMGYGLLAMKLYKGEE